MAIKERTVIAMKYKKGTLFAKHQTSQSMDHLPKDCLIREIELRNIFVGKRSSIAGLLSLVKKATASK